MTANEKTTIAVRIMGYAAFLAALVVWVTHHLIHKTSLPTGELVMIAFLIVTGIALFASVSKATAILEALLRIAQQWQRRNVPPSERGPEP